MWCSFLCCVFVLKYGVKLSEHEPLPTHYEKCNTHCSWNTVWVPIWFEVLTVISSIRQGWLDLMHPFQLGIYSDFITGFSFALFHFGLFFFFLKSCINCRRWHVYGKIFTRVIESKFCNWFHGFFYTKLSPFTAGKNRYDKLSLSFTLTSFNFPWPSAEHGTEFAFTIVLIMETESWRRKKSEVCYSKMSVWILAEANEDTTETSYLELPSAHGFVWRQEWNPLCFQRSKPKS